MCLALQGPQLELWRYLEPEKNMAGDDVLFCNWLLLRVKKTQATPISPYPGTFWGFFSKFPTSIIWGSLSSCKRTGYKNENNDRENLTTIHIHSLSFIPSDIYAVKRLIMVFVAMLFKYFKLGRSVVTTAALFGNCKFCNFFFL